jgi:protein arginine kinase
MTKNPHLPKVLLDHTLWENPSNPIWPGTSFSLHRNLARSFFPGKMEQSELQRTLLSLCDSLLTLPQLNHATLLKAEELTPIDKEYLYEHFLSSQSFENTSNGQGFVVDESGQFLSLLNVQDHLQIQWSDSEGKWENAWEQLSNIEAELNKRVEFAYAPRFGYLTSDPHLCGTGLIVKVYLHVPALIHSKQLQEKLQQETEEFVETVSLDDRSDMWIGDILVLRNRFTLGVSEETILSTLHGAAMKWMGLEKALRKELSAQENPTIKDEVCRAYGLLSHSYQLQAQEVLGALSLLSLGSHLNWISGVNLAQLNTLFFRCQRAHLLYTMGQQKANLSDVSHLRAQFLHEQMRSIVCNIES